MPREAPAMMMTMRLIRVCSWPTRGFAWPARGGQWAIRSKDSSKDVQDVVARVNQAITNANAGHSFTKAVDVVKAFKGGNTAGSAARRQLTAELADCGETAAYAAARPSSKRARMHEEPSHRSGSSGGGMAATAAVDAGDGGADDDDHGRAAAATVGSATIAGSGSKAFSIEDADLIDVNHIGDDDDGRDRAGVGYQEGNRANSAWQRGRRLVVHYAIV